MTRTTLSAFTIAVSSAVALFTASGAAVAATEPCSQTATQAFQACKADVTDDYRLTLGNCINIGDANARQECVDDAKDTRQEERELCDDQREARLNVCGLVGQGRYDPDPLLDPNITFINPNKIPAEYPVNPYVSLATGHTYVLRAGEDFEELVVVHVTDEIRKIQGVKCRVVVDIVVEVEEDDKKASSVEYIPVEVTDDWFAQDDQSNVYYCGELSRNFEDGLLVDIDGSFEAGVEYAKAGTLVRAIPTVGDADRQEFALGEAEDAVEYLNLAAAPKKKEGGENPAFPCAPTGCLKTLEFSPLEPEGSEFKYYLANTGFVLAVDMEDGKATGEREELVCVGDSLKILKQEACGIKKPKALLETLCGVAPDTFCEDD